VFIRIDFSKLLIESKEHVIDMKGINAELLEGIKAHGVDIIQTKYFLKKDAYAIMMSRDMKRMLLCNVNERCVISADHSLFSD
jgi:hypothetical protein